MTNKDITTEQLQEVLKDQESKMGFKGVETIGEACIDPGLLKREPLFVEAVIDFKTGKLLWTEPYDFSRLNGIGERFIRKAVIYKVVDVEVIEGKSVTLIEYTVENLGNAY